ncbi:hypothetical protein BD410DRAFT_709231 [Rickenella mellea]|uniref:BTB domain-containing protein n=1 Tax=Rickenella mellea TaxID=50990 RepID=A0A4R5XDZ8_9AGAM|nr:hypothetical protein BD410DRAFT_709231 [Rickenella mellea]
MSDLNLHHSPGPSSSPRPSPLSRPHWPWTTYSHRTLSSSSSLSGLGQPSSSWDPSASTNSSATATWQTSSVLRHSTIPVVNSSISTHNIPEDSMRHWSFTAFEWVIRDVHKLRDLIEAPQDNTVPSDENDEKTADIPEILKETPILGDQKFKLEVGEIFIAHAAVGTAAQTLSLYITSLILDYPHADEISASMMAAIKCQDDKVGERGARPDWVWEFWQNEWTFRPESEVWECALPSLSSLLENPRISETDSFVICIQIHSPTGPFFPQQPSSYYVPRDLLDGLEASLDNPHTGDVRFVCIERHVDPQGPTSPQTAHSRLSSSSSSQSLAPVHFTGRKRILYAHCDILVRRSEYFATMFASAFAEGAIPPTDERRVLTVVVEEADFVTIYWLLKWVYANWLLFQEEDDPRAAVDGMGTGWNAGWLTDDRSVGEWDWKPVSKPMSADVSASRDEIGSVASGGSAESSQRTKLDPGPSPKTPQTPNTPTAIITSTGSPISKVPTRTPQTFRPSQGPSTSSRRAPSSSASSSKSTAVNSASPVTRTGPPPPPPIPRSQPTSNYGMAHSLSPRQPRQLAIPPTPDPHPHPTPAPNPASALCVYQVAHRYQMPGLASLALEHIMNTISPKSSFPLLLASTVWDELHMLVEDYVVEHWDEVSASDDFDKCCQEVAAGEWGLDGGKTLVMLFRRLRSPTSRFVRP